MRLHLVGLPHTQLVRDTVVCAFTAKAHKFVEMMLPLGYDITTYWGDSCDLSGIEHVPLFSTSEQKGWFGDVDPNVLPTLPVWDGRDAWWQITNARAIAEIARRIQPGDLILLLAGENNRSIMNAFPGNISCEWAAGYPGWMTNQVCFESYAWMHHCYGTRNIHDGRWFDTVIPNFFRPEDFVCGPEQRHDNLVYIGRLIERKGIMTAWEVARATGRDLTLAGSGAASYKNRTLTTMDGCVLTDVTYAGPVNAAERNALMRHASAVIVPTTYIEPFGAVCVEAQLCGTPVLTTDWGAFPELVQHGRGGYRFRTLGQAVEAINSLHDLDSPGWIRQAALERFSLRAVGPQYDRWFKMLDSLWREGWYETADASFTILA